MWLTCSPDAGRTGELREEGEPWEYPLPNLLGVSWPIQRVQAFAVVSKIVFARKWENGQN